MKKKSGIARKLDEFGWLWALKNRHASWEQISVEVKYVSNEIFNRDCSFGAKVWAYGLNKVGIPDLLDGSGGWEPTLGSKALYSCGIDAIEERVQYIAVQERGMTGAITVYRMPKVKGFQTLWNFLQRYDPSRDNR